MLFSHDKIKDHLIGSIDISASDPKRRHFHHTYPILAIDGILLI